VAAVNGNEAKVLNALLETTIFEVEAGHKIKDGEHELDTRDLLTKTVGVLLDSDKVKEYEGKAEKTDAVKWSS